MPGQCWSGGHERLGTSPCVSEGTLLLVRAAIFSWCFFILAQSAFHEGPGCLRFFTVWNFIVLTVFFGIGTGLSCTCCRHSAECGPITRDHRIWAGLHRLLFEIELPMTMLVAVIVWFAIYPNAVSVAQQTGDYSGQLAVPSLCPLTPTVPNPGPKPSPIPGPKPSPSPSPNANPNPHQVLSLTSITMHPHPNPNPTPHPNPNPHPHPTPNPSPNPNPN